MRFILSVLIILILNYVLGLFLPWWIIAIVGFLSGYLIVQATVKSVLSGLIAGFVLWSVLALFIDIANEQVLSKKIAGLFRLPQPWLMIIVTGFIGGLVTGMGALTGSLLRSFTQRPKSI
ncbi:hypothetical protein ACX0G7_00725 [Flavitalea antarctica]